MKLKKLVSTILSISMLASCVAATGVTASAQTTESYNDYQNMLSQTTAENKYGLADTVNEGKILQAWNWSYENVIAQMETVANQGFTTIQVSPPNEIKMPTKGVTVCTPDNSNGWWMFYQPAGFQLNESTDNALGTKAEFKKMCEEADKYGLKILVDAVINHMGTDDDHVGDPYDNDSTDPMKHVTPRAAEFETEILEQNAFHSPWIDCTYVENLNQKMPQYDANWKPILDPNCQHCWGTTKYKCDGAASVADITNSITRHCTSGLPDLDTSQQVVQDAIYDYLEELVIAGADGFRIDAAKHIETTEDLPEFASDFWENTLLKIREKYPDCEAYAYGEILNKCGDGRPFSMYTKMMDVTDSSSYWGIKDAVCNNGSNGNSIPSYPSYEDANLYGQNHVKFTKENAIQWNESHDTYIDGSTSFLTVEQRDKIWALTAARQTITGVYFARPDDRTGNNKADIEKICSDILLGEANVTSWANPAVKAVNQFSNYYGDAAEYLSVQNKMTLIERGGTGATIVNLDGTKEAVNVTSLSLADGTYTDAITGNTFTVAEGNLTGQIGSSGIAVIYYSMDTEPVIPEPIDYSQGFPTKEGYYTVVFTNNKNWSNVNLYCWNETTKEEPVSWPGDSMRYALTNDYGESQYMFYVPTYCDRIIFNNGGDQTVDIPISNHGAYYLDGDYSKYNVGTFNVTFIGDNTNPSQNTEPSTDATEPVDYSNGYPIKDGYYTVVFSNNKGWNNVNLYCWNNATKQEPASWPGNAMTYALTNDYGEAQYVAYVPTYCDSIIFNNGSEQTEDITISGHSAYYLTGDYSKYNVGTFDVTFVEPTSPTKPSESEPIPSETEPNESKPGETEPSETVKPTQPATKKPSIKVAKKTLKAGQQTTVTVKNAGKKKVTYKSLNPKVATVSSKGVVKALGKGTAKITATVKGYGKLTCKVTVKTSPKLYKGKKAIKKNKTYTVKKGKTLTLTIKGKAKGVNNSYKTSNKKIAKVTSKNNATKVKIKGYKKGTAKITVTINKNYKTTIKVTVK